MNSVILQAASKYLSALLLALAYFLLLRGHQLPGGGFIAGLVAACAGILHEMAWEQTPPRWVQPCGAFTFIVLGWTIALLSAIVALFHGQPLMTAQWWGEVWLPLVGKTKLGTVFFFDGGVFFLVWGMVLSLGNALKKDEA